MVSRFLRNDTCMYGYSIVERVTLEKDGNKRQEAEIVTYNSLFQFLMLQNCSSFKGQKVSLHEKVLKTFFSFSVVVKWCLTKPHLQVLLQKGTPRSFLHMNASELLLKHHHHEGDLLMSRVSWKKKPKSHIKTLQSFFLHLEGKK